MNIIFSRHARLKLLQRKISLQAVQEAVLVPDIRMPGRNLREELYKKYGALYLKVVVKQERSALVVVTAHLVAKVKHT